MAGRAGRPREGLFIRRGSGLNKVMLSRDLAARAGERLRIFTRGGSLHVHACTGEQGRKIHNSGRCLAVSDADTWLDIPDGRIYLEENEPGQFTEVQA